VREFIEAARSIGVPSSRLLRRHVLPNIASPVIVEISLALGQVLLTETALSFLGLGPPPPDPSWGAMLNERRAFTQCAPWAVLAPGGAIVVTTAAFLLIGNGLRAALNPRPLRHAHPRRSADAHPRFKQIAKMGLDNPARRC
jgi:ABC-type dipeptide/oligopeptide/nickel transport system permease subunit